MGAPCGVMDQVTSACGQVDQLVAPLCQPAELQEVASIPDDVAFWGIDSGIRHAESGADYGSVRVGAFMGYRILADLAGLKVRDDVPLQIDDPNWRGYLANVTPALFEQHYVTKIPERMKGADFLDQYGGTTDAVTQVDPDREYAVRIPCRHPIYEHFRNMQQRRVAILIFFLALRREQMLLVICYWSLRDDSKDGMALGGIDF